MKTILFVCATLYTTHLAAQTMRYFEVGLRIEPNSENYDGRDSSFIVAASDALLLAEIEAELALPPSERVKHISGPLIAGNGTFNHNGNFWFNWHLAPNEWRLSDFSIELCDGRPYTDIEQDLNYWIGNVGTFCPWSSYIKREVSQPVSVKDPLKGTFFTLSIYPNPARSETTFSWDMPESGPANLQIADREGRLEINIHLGILPQGPYTKPISTTALTPGVYVATIEANGKRRSNLFVVQGE